MRKRMWMRTRTPTRTRTCTRTRPRTRTVSQPRPHRQHEGVGEFWSRRQRCVHATDQKQRTAEVLRERVLPTLGCGLIVADVSAGSGEIAGTLVSYFSQTVPLDNNKRYCSTTTRPTWPRCASDSHDEPVRIELANLDTYDPNSTADLVLFSFVLASTGLTLDLAARLEFCL